MSLQGRRLAGRAPRAATGASFSRGLRHLHYHLFSERRKAAAEATERICSTTRAVPATGTSSPIIGPVSGSGTTCKTSATDAPSPASASTSTVHGPSGAYGTSSGTAAATDTSSTTSSPARSSGDTLEANTDRPSGNNQQAHLAVLLERSQYANFSREETARRRDADYSRTRAVREL